MHAKGLVIAGTHSGCGKTSLTTGIIRALRQKNLKVQPFKSGPDYIDPGFHSLAANTVCRNLDTRMMGQDAVRHSYWNAAKNADISIIEGVMGLFDGSGIGDERGSTAHLAKILGLPVLLVIDAKGMARSAAALARGYTEFDSQVNIAGYILNRIGSRRHADLLIPEIENATGRPVVGAVCRNEDWSMPARQLGLVPAWEHPDVEKRITQISTQIVDEINLDKLIDIADIGDSCPQGLSTFTDIFKRFEKFSSQPLIAIARDEAFCFYYQDNLDMLKAAGAKLVTFSPLHDQRLPDGTSALLIGGGYPEIHAARLAANQPMRQSIRNMAEKAMPILAECGGYMYLADALVDEKGVSHMMTGVLPGTSIYSKRLKSLGYCQVSLMRDTILGPAGTNLSGHVFHWSQMTGLSDRPPLFSIGNDSADIGAGDCIRNVLGSWLHIHFASNPDAVYHFVRSASLWKEKRI